MANNADNRVVVSGIGCFSPLGLDMATTWENLIAGKSGIDYITLFDASNLDTRFAGEVKGFEPTNYIDRKEARRMDRFSQLSVAASMQAVEQSGIKINSTGYVQCGDYPLGMTKLVIYVARLISQLGNKLNAMSINSLFHPR